MSKKKVFTLALAVCLIAILSMSSLAWFTDDDSVTNDFLIAGSDDANPDEVFSIDVTETGDDDDNGLVYEDILPGDVLKKEVFVENTGSYDQYARVIVVVSNAREWMAAMDKTGTQYPALSQIVNGLNTGKWDPSTANNAHYDPANNTFWYVLYVQETLAVDEQVKVFDSVKIPETMTREDAAAFAGGFSIKVVAQAVQTKNLGVDNAAAAFIAIGWTEEAAYEQIMNP